MLTAAKLGLTTPIGHRPVTSASILELRRRMDAEAKRERRQIILCAAVGVLLNACVVLGTIGLAKLLGAIHRHPVQNLMKGSLILGAVLCGFMLLVALITKPAGRAERASQMLDISSHNTGRHDPIASAGTLFLMFLALYGSYAIVEASKRTWMRCRLWTVDRNEAARLLAVIIADPSGVSLGTLCAAGHTPLTLRKPLAVLLLDGWVRLADGGRAVMLQSPAMRSLHRRHPLAEVFAPGE